MNDLNEQLKNWRRALHRIPELSNQESKTAIHVQTILKALDISFRSGIAGNGIIGEIEGKKKGPFIALRSDMDALPVLEQTGLEFASIHQGCMHACGHDAHMAILLGAATLFKKGDPPPLPVRLIFQPAEEVAEGAKAMIEAGALKDVLAIFGGHVDRHFPAGKLVVTPGIVNASTDEFAIEIRGHGGHGGRPHESVDSIVVGSLLVMALQTLVSREVNPLHPTVVSVGVFQAGEAANVLAARSSLRGTIRAHHPDDREHLKRGIERITKSFSELYQVEINLMFQRGTPCVFNSKEMATLCQEAATSIVGTENVWTMHNSSMGGEDFAYYLEQVKGAYIRFGSRKEGFENFPAHSERFDVNENALLPASQYLHATVFSAAKRHEEGKLDPL